MQPMIEQVTFVIPAYNAEKHIEDTLQSIISQTYLYWKVIIVNDGSTDETERILKEYAKRDARITYITIPNTGSAHIPRLTGIERATSKWVCSIDSDDYIETEYLEKMVAIALKWNADIVCPQMIYMRDGYPIRMIPAKDNKLPHVMDGKQAALLTFKNGLGSLIPMTNGLLINKKTLSSNLIAAEIENKQNGVYRDEVFALMEFLNSEVVTLSTSKYYYRFNEDSVTHTPSVKSYDKLLSDIDFKNIVCHNFVESRVRLIINRRFLDLLIHRRIKYIKEKKSYTQKQQDGIEKMFFTAYHQLNRGSEYPLFKKLLFVVGGFVFFKLSAKIVYFLKYKR